MWQTEFSEHTPNENGGHHTWVFDGKSQEPLRTQSTQLYTMKHTQAFGLDKQKITKTKKNVRVKNT